MVELVLLMKLAIIVNVQIAGLDPAAMVCHIQVYMELSYQYIH